jgi:sugar lactone lactonase YvrE
MKSTKLLSPSRLALLLTTLPLSLACGSSPSPGGPGNPGGTNDAGGAPFADGGVAPGTDAGVGAGDAAADADAAPLPVVKTYLPGATVTTLAGSDTEGTADGTGAAAQFSNPTGLALDTSGDLIVADYDSGRVRRVTTAGVVTTIGATPGFTDVFSVALGGDGTIYLGTDADATGNKGTLTGTLWALSPASGAIAAPTVVAKNFGRPRGLAPMPGGSLLLTDRVQDVAEGFNLGSAQATWVAGAAGMPGAANGAGAAARFAGPVGVARMPDGSFVIADEDNNLVRRVTAAGVVTTLAGNGAPTLVDGSCADASFSSPRAIAADGAGNVYVTDIGFHVVRQIDTTCTVQTLAGSGTAGFADGAGGTAQFYGLEGLAVSADGKNVYVTDGNNGDASHHHRVRVIAIP